MPSKFKLAKLAINTTAGVGVSKVVNDIIKNNTTVETAPDAVKVLIGSIVIGSMVADVSSKRVNAGVDAVAKWWEERKQENPDEESAS